MCTKWQEMMPGFDATAWKPLMSWVNTAGRSVNQDLDFWKLWEILVESNKWCSQEGSTKGRNCSAFGGCRGGQSSVLSVNSLGCHSPFSCPCLYSHQTCLLSLVDPLLSKEKSWSLRQSETAFLLELGSIWGSVCLHEPETERISQPKSEQKIRSMRELSLEEDGEKQKLSSWKRKLFFTYFW